jgi:hypothetical protein
MLSQYYYQISENSGDHSGLLRACQVYAASWGETFQKPTIEIPIRNNGPWAMGGFFLYT